MAIQGIEQPQIIDIDPGLRLRKYDGIYDFAFDWYQDEEMVYLVDGARSRYSRERLQRMYQYLDSHGELYFIEVAENGVYRPIGDVTFWQEDMPIVIGDAGYRGQKIGQKVVEALVRRGKELGYPYLRVSEIYRYNIASQKCFEHAGFQVCEETEKGRRYQLNLT